MNVFSFTTDQNLRLRRRIMRRVYLVYTGRLVATPGLIEGAVMFSSLLALTQFVSLGNVLANLQSIPVGHVHHFFYNAVSTTEIWTLLLGGVMIFAALSVRLGRPFVSFGRLSERVA
jgi:hypothetical protein